MRFLGWSTLAVTTALLLASAGETDGPTVDQAADPAVERAVAVMDLRAEQWGRERRCVTCHTNGLALIAQPVAGSGRDEVERTRQFAVAYLTGYTRGDRKPAGQHGSVTGLVATTAFLAMADARLPQTPGGDRQAGSGEAVAPSRGVAAATREGLDHAWSTLGESGTWDGWLRCNWPPFEADLAFAPTLMLVALGEVEERFGAGELSPRDREGAAALQGWLRAHPPEGLHDRAMRVWAGVHFEGVGEAADLEAWRQELRDAQREDGGWPMGALAADSWRHDSGRVQAEQSGAYATAFSLYVLLMAGAQADDGRVVRGKAWLREHQRPEGSWEDRSPRRDGRHFIGRAATAFAVMVLAMDGEGSGASGK